ncbi:unnamed protein product, partial [Owenia fusiformis]
VLLGNLVKQMTTQMSNSKSEGDSPHALLEKCMAEIGVTFKIWEKRENQSGTGTFDYTPLMGSDLKCVIRRLPEMFVNLMPNATAQKPKAVWNQLGSIYFDALSSSTNDHEKLFKMAQKFLKSFLNLHKSSLEGFANRNVTPYMHMLLYHVPNQVRRLDGRFKSFTGQHIEKANDT